MSTPRKFHGSWQETREYFILAQILNVVVVLHETTIGVKFLPPSTPYSLNPMNRFHRIDQFTVRASTWTSHCFVGPNGLRLPKGPCTLKVTILDLSRSFWPISTSGIWNPLVLPSLKEEKQRYKTSKYPGLGHPRRPFSPLTEPWSKQSQGSKRPTLSTPGWIWTGLESL